MFSINSKIQKLINISRDISDLSGVQSLLEWDQETYMPVNAGEARGKQMDLIAGFAHKLLTDAQTGALVSSLEQDVLHNPGVFTKADRALIREFKRVYDRATKLPNDFVYEMVAHTSASVEAWKKAKKSGDFSTFSPYLKKMLELKLQESVYRGYKDNPYDAHLDTYEPGLTSPVVSDIFEPLKAFTIDLIKKIQSSPVKIDTSILHRSYPVDNQVVLAKLIAKGIGYDFASGSLDLSTHPFTTEFNTSSDVRITTRVRETELTACIMATIHEVGHALYEQGVAKELDRTVLGSGTSLGMHESQSRMWENFVGRSDDFWQAWYPEVLKAFPDVLTSEEHAAFVSALNAVKPSLIRVEADEVTYNLHIIIRFELEKALFDGSLKVEDLPAAWNAKYKEYLGVAPANDTEGVLQDIHWSGGSFGYFPTYTLGNLYAAQLWHKIDTDIPDLKAKISSGNTSDLLSWLRNNIHKHGKIYSAAELCKMVTGEDLNAKYLTNYLQDKYLGIYTS